MSNVNAHSLRDPRKQDRRLLRFGLVVVMGLIACSPTNTSDPHGEGRAQVMVREPVVERDLEDIRETGTLRVLLRNDSSSYYVLQGQEYGFEFEVVRELAREMDLRLRVVLPDSEHAPLEMLNLGEVDVVASPLYPEEHPEVEVAYTSPYHRVYQTLVVNTALADSIHGPPDLGGVMVAARRYSSGEKRLFALRRSGIPVGIVMHPFETSTEELLDLVADGTYSAAVALDRDVGAQLRFRDELHEAFPLSDEREVRWAVRSNSPDLLAAVNRALRHHYRLREDDTVARSEFYAVVADRYFGNSSRVQRHAEHPFRLGRTGKLSPYDELFQQAAEDYRLDWRLLAALSFQESRFDPEAASWAGAVGLMQVKPAVVGIGEDSLKIAEVNVPAGAAHLRSLFDVYDFLPGPQQLRFALAAYNCGQGHLDDARMLAIRRGKDPNVWEGSVRESLMLLRDPQYHRQARYGYVRAGQTVTYVREILQRYDLLRHLTRERRNVGLTAASQTLPGPAN